MQDTSMIPTFIVNLFKETLPEEQPEIFESKIPVEGHEGAYYFGRFHPSGKVLVVREDGSVPFFEEVEPVVERVLQYESLKKSNDLLYVLLTGEQEMYQSLVQMLEEIKNHYEEHMDLFPKEEFQRVTQTSHVLFVQQGDLEKANEELNQLASNVYRNHEITPSNLMKLKALHISVAQLFQKQILTYNKTTQDERVVVEYLYRHTPIWKFNWRGVLRDLKSVQKQIAAGLSKELLEDSNVTHLFSKGASLSQEEKEMVMEQVVNHKTEVVMELMKELEHDLNQV
ncbi:hypothetical protein J2Z48_002447 [Croceifilum oryzae]|uniref:Uncharacterized protein n=1 Tax=Croceifilum oryzae TaxID=1553429 RepID=A0AAJ1WR75_9BACL|nr:hypothetical protein [Croceifilum oryzae]MDQ0418257.1 hypothetical protein [Croceifilum oryzae]